MKGMCRIWGGFVLDSQDWEAKAKSQEIIIKGRLWLQVLLSQKSSITSAKGFQGDF